MSFPVSLPLTGSVLCVDCETLSNSEKSCCACGSSSLLALDSVLGTLPKKRAIAVNSKTPREFARQKLVDYRGDSVPDLELQMYTTPLPQNRIDAAISQAIESVDRVNQRPQVRR